MNALPVLRSARVYAQAGAIALLSTSGRGREHFVRAGEALERVWLTATRLDIAVQPMAGITLLVLRLLLGAGEGLSSAQRRRLEVLHGRLRGLFPVLSSDTPILLLRLGRAAPPSARTPRLPLGELLIIEGGGR